METEVSCRVGPDTGFVYVNDTRIGFSPGEVARPPIPGVITIWGARNWPEATAAEVKAAIDALTVHLAAAGIEKRIVAR